MAVPDTLAFGLEPTAGAAVSTRVLDLLRLARTTPAAGPTRRLPDGANLHTTEKRFNGVGWEIDGGKAVSPGQVVSEAVQPLEE